MAEPSWSTYLKAMCLHGAWLLPPRCEGAVGFGQLGAGLWPQGVASGVAWCQHGQQGQSPGWSEFCSLHHGAACMTLSKTHLSPIPLRAQQPAHVLPAAGTVLCPFIPAHTPGFPLLAHASISPVIIWWDPYTDRPQTHLLLHHFISCSCSLFCWFWDWGTTCSLVQPCSIHGALTALLLRAQSISMGNQSCKEPVASGH